MKMETYLVGGAVRDKLLGIPIRDSDWVVVGAREQQMLEQGFIRVGKDFPVFLHPDTRQEYALARTESKVGHGYKGFDVDASMSVTLEQDLRRRDLTINAMAENANGELIDPYGGKVDLENRVLRHVSPAFSEDPLRVLRVARFAARFHHLGFTIAEETLALMANIVDSGELAHLVPERTWQEFDTALSEAAPAVFIKTLRDCGALQALLPEVDRLFGVPQPQAYHPEVDTGVHVLMCLEQATCLTSDPVVRYAVLVHDVGKGVTPKDNWPHHYQHENLGVELVDAIAQRLRVPNHYAELARLVCKHHTRMHRVEEMRSSKVLDLLEALDAFRRPQRMTQFLLACEADARGRLGLEQREYPQRDFLQQALAAADSVDVGAMLAARQATGTKTDDVKSLVHQHRTEAIRQQLQRDC